MFRKCCGTYTLVAQRSAANFLHKTSLVATLRHSLHTAALVRAAARERCSKITLQHVTRDTRAHMPASAHTSTPMCVVQTRAAPPGAAGPWGEQDCPGQMIWYVFHKTGPTCTTCCREVLHDLQQHIPLCHFCIFALLPPSIPASALGHCVFGRWQPSHQLRYLL